MLKRLLTIAVVVTTIAWSMGAAFVPTASAVVSLTAGDLIKASGPAVYYYAADGERYTYATESTYFSWRADFSGIKTITDNELSNIDLAGNVVMRPGSDLIKIDTVPKVYAVESNGKMRHIADEAAAATLYGADWAKKIKNIPDGFWSNYTDTGMELDGTEYPEGTLVKENAGADVYRVNEDGTWSKIANEAAFNANRFNWGYVQSAPNAMSFTAGADLTGAVAEYLDDSQGGGTIVTPVGGPLTVSLSTNTPTSMTVPANTPVEFTKIKLSAGADSVSVTSLVLSLYGLGDYDKVTAITLFDAGSKVSTTKNMASNRQAVFNFSTPFVISAYSTKELTVKATLTAEGYYSLGVDSAAHITSNAASISGAFPIVGNQMYATTTASGSVGTVTMSNITTAATTDHNFGEDDVLLASFDLTANNEPILWNSAKLKNGGTNVDGIVENLKLYVNGDIVSEGVYLDGYANFTLNSLLIDKSDTVNVEVRGDLGVANSGNTIKLYMKDRIDFAFVGQDMGFGAQVTTDAIDNAIGWDDFNTADEGIVITLVTGDFSIDMDKSVTPAQDVKPGTNDVVLATFKMMSNAENATVTGISDTGAADFEIQGTGLGAGEITNIEMVDVATGAIYDITASRVDDTEWTLSMTDEISLLKGVQKTFSIRADMDDTIDDPDTLKIVVAGTAMTITGDSSSSSITNVTPSSVTSAITTIKDASLELDVTPLTAVTVVPEAYDEVIYKGQLKTGSADGVNVKTVMLTTLTDVGDVFADTNITKLDLYLDGKLLKSVSNNIVEVVGAAGDTITFNSLNATYATIPASTTVSMEVKATFASTFATTGNFTLEVADAGDLTSRSVIGSNVVTTTGTITGASRTVTLAATGTLSVELATAGANVSRDSFLLAGSTMDAGRYLGELKFTTANEAVKVTELRLVDNGTAGNDDISAIKLIDSTGTVVATQAVAVNGDVVFDPFNIVFPADETTSLYISAVAKGINVLNDPTSTADVGATLQYNINPTAGVVAQGNSSGVSISMIPDANGTLGDVDNEWSKDTVKSRTAYIVGSKLNSIAKDMSDTTLTGGVSKIVGKYTFTFDNGANRNTSNEELKAIMDALTVTFSKSSAVVVATVSAQIDGTSTKVAANTLTTLGAGNTTGSATWNATTLQGLVDSGKVDGEVTLVITADLSAVTTGQYLQTSISDLSGSGDDDDFNYIAEGLLAGTSLTNMYLPVTEVVGATLSN